MPGHAQELNSSVSSCMLSSLESVGALRQCWRPAFDSGLQGRGLAIGVAAAEVGVRDTSSTTLETFVKEKVVNCVDCAEDDALKLPADSSGLIEVDA